MSTDTNANANDTDANPFVVAAIEDIVANTDIVVEAYLGQFDGLDDKVSFLDVLRDALYDKGKHTAFNPAYESAKKAKERVTQGYDHCEFCHAYSESSSWTEDSMRETEWEQTHTDAGWGDDDCFAEVTRMNFYKICPKCGHRVRTKSWYLSTGPEKTRSQLRSEWDAKR